MSFNVYIKPCKSRIIFIFTECRVDSHRSIFQIMCCVLFCVNETINAKAANLITEKLQMCWIKLYHWISRLKWFILKCLLWEHHVLYMPDMCSALLTSYFWLDNVQSAFPLEHFPQNRSTLHNFEILVGKYSSVFVHRWGNRKSGTLFFLCLAQYSDPCF